MPIRGNCASKTGKVPPEELHSMRTDPEDWETEHGTHLTPITAKGLARFTIDIAAVPIIMDRQNLLFVVPRKTQSLNEARA